MSMIEEFRKRYKLWHVNRPNKSELDLNGWHCEILSAGWRILRQATNRVSNQLPLFTAEFLKNIVFTAAMEWQQVFGQKIEDIWRDPDLLRQHAKIGDLYEIFRRTAQNFIIDPYQRDLIATCRGQFITSFLECR